MIKDWINSGNFFDGESFLDHGSAKEEVIVIQGSWQTNIGIGNEWITYDGLPTSGAAPVTYEDAGGAISILSVSGADAVISVDTGYSVSILAVSGLDALVSEDAGNTTSILIASGADEYLTGPVTYEDTGCAVSELVVSGVDVYTTAISDIGVSLAYKPYSKRVRFERQIRHIVYEDTGAVISNLSISGADDYEQSVSYRGLNFTKNKDEEELMLAFAMLLLDD
jgi:hypothetical protein